MYTFLSRAGAGGPGFGRSGGTLGWAGAERGPGRTLSKGLRRARGEERLSRPRAVGRRRGRGTAGGEPRPGGAALPPGRSLPRPGRQQPEPGASGWQRQTRFLWAFTLLNSSVRVTESGLCSAPAAN